jgi:hypothetical protein
MFAKRYFLYAASVSLALGLAGAGQAAKYSLQNGSGTQGHIGNGLSLPIQPAFGGAGQALPAVGSREAGVVTVQGTSAMTKARRSPFHRRARTLHSEDGRRLRLEPTLYASQQTWAHAGCPGGVLGQRTRRPATQVITATLAPASRSATRARHGKRFGGVGRTRRIRPPAGIPCPGDSLRDRGQGSRQSAVHEPRFPGKCGLCRCLDRGEARQQGPPEAVTQGDHNPCPGPTPFYAQKAKAGEEPDCAHGGRHRYQGRTAQRLRAGATRGRPARPCRR